jgi:hypothetical protein
MRLNLNSPTGHEDPRNAGVDPWQAVEASKMALEPTMKGVRVKKRASAIQSKSSAYHGVD